MKIIIGILAGLMLMQFFFDVMIFNGVIHGEVAWRWQTEPYPGYYCGQHSCTLNNSHGIQPN